MAGRFCAAGKNVLSEIELRECLLDSEDSDSDSDFSVESDSSGDVYENMDPCAEVECEITEDIPNPKC